MTSQTIQDLPDPTTVPTAGFLPRVAAYLVDQFVMIPVMYATFYFMVEQPLLYAVIALWLVQSLYKPLTESFLGFTVGKWIMRLRVVDRGTNRKIGLNQSFVRYLPFAVSAFATLFVQIRMFETPEFREVNNLELYVNYMSSFPLNQNLLVNICNNLPVFSAVWLIMDPWSRALHDRWAQTFVIRLLPQDANR
ncbi:putative RDD family membrane protein YckC [Lewinella aquimaris]|uniref:Putative RDD family membrane protein YckC n=1 Tax=Neolewinella aquimaris TaxID=1835722 RepID=A0A840E7V7_9BACT|nr:RDD family protein [Neolewinella aquimaris]MBB4078148.1 putative RDD family membrane protein YckC [Neolewinella aquimaris]